MFFLNDVFLSLYEGLTNGEIIAIILSTSFAMWILVITMSVFFGVVRRAGFSAIVKRQTVTQGQPQLPALEFNDATPTDVTSFITTNSMNFNPLYQPDELVDDGFNYYYGPNRRNVSGKII